MHLKVILPLIGVVLVCGCSQSTKKPSPSPAPGVAPVASATPVPTKQDPPAKSEPPPKSQMTCQRGAESRLLEIESVQPQGCQLWYSRYEIKGVVASSSRANTHCEQVRERIRGKLVDAGFTCQAGPSQAKPNVVAPPTPAPQATPAPAPQATDSSKAESKKK